MIPTLSSRARPDPAEAAYWRRHPPTSWKASQALLLEESGAQPDERSLGQTRHRKKKKEVDADLLPEVGLTEAGPTEPVVDRSVVSGPFQATTTPSKQPEPGDANGREWLPLLLWNLVVLIDAVMALRELVAPWTAHWKEKAPWELPWTAAPRGNEKELDGCRGRPALIEE